MKLLRLIGDGLIAMAEPYAEPRKYAYPKLNGFKNDNEKLKGDVSVVGRGVSKSIKEHGRKQSY